MYKRQPISYPTVKEENSKDVCSLLKTHFSSNIFFYIYLSVGILQSTIIMKSCCPKKIGKIKFHECDFPNYFDGNTTKRKKSVNVETPLINKSTFQLYPLNSTKVPTIVK